MDKDKNNKHTIQNFVKCRHSLTEDNQTNSQTSQSSSNQNDNLIQFGLFHGKNFIEKSQFFHQNKNELKDKETGSQKTIMYNIPPEIDFVQDENSNDQSNPLNEVQAEYISQEFLQQNIAKPNLMNNKLPTRNPINNFNEKEYYKTAQQQPNFCIKKCEYNLGVVPKVNNNSLFLFNTLIKMLFIIKISSYSYNIRI